jgi:predicted solute-binding protein
MGTAFLQLPRALSVTAAHGQTPHTLTLESTWHHLCTAVTIYQPLLSVLLTCCAQSEMEDLCFAVTDTATFCSRLLSVLLTCLFVRRVR